MIRRILITTIRWYQKTLSPDHGIFRFRFPFGFCRYQPTCSNYALQALSVHGVIRGVCLALWRILRCHPFARGGVDFVPKPTSEREN